MIRAYEPYVAPRQAEFVADALARNELSHHGGYHAAFERRVGEAAGRAHAVLTSSGTTALAALYHAAGLRGKRVLAPTLTYVATVNQLVAAGATPVLVDCDDRLQMDVDRAARVVLGGDVEAAVAAPLYGDCPAMKRLADACRSAGVPLYVDAAQAFAAECGGRPVAKYGEAAAHSHFVNKVLTSGGEGGSLVTDDPELAARARSFVNHATIPGYRHTSPYATNARLTNLQAAVGVAQHMALPEILAAKRRVLDAYAGALGGAVVYPSTGLAWMVVARLRPGATFAAALAACAARGVELRPVFPPMHTLPGIRPHVALSGDMTASERAADGHLLLPSGPALTAAEIARVVDAVRPFVID